MPTDSTRRIPPSPSQPPQPMPERIDKAVPDKPSPPPPSPSRER